MLLFRSRSEDIYRYTASLYGLCWLHDVRMYAAALSLQIDALTGPAYDELLMPFAFSVALQ